ncbi:hypothetical protein FRC02_006635 [Tulasnella sp. 418]|nr:hypothetical protein FRC02_006635 [Tulasnella sp. 418]
MKLLFLVHCLALIAFALAMPVPEGAVELPNHELNPKVIRARMDESTYASLFDKRNLYQTMGKKWSSFKAASAVKANTAKTNMDFKFRDWTKSITGKYPKPQKGKSTKAKQE